MQLLCEGYSCVACMIEIAGGWWRWYAIDAMLQGNYKSFFSFLLLMAILVVGRKLAEKGYTRSAKKCKEKFENVHKYYKRTKGSRAGRNDGKTYRFFTQLEALHGTAGGPAAAASLLVPPSGAAGPSAVRVPAEPPPAMAAGMPFGNQSFSTSNTEDYSDEEDSDDEGTQELGGGGADERGKRKRVSSDQDGGAAAAAAGGSGSGKMMRFFEGLMKQVMERQEAMQQRFLEAIEKREQDRMIREEAWRRQEMTRLAHEQEILAQERAMAASRDAAVLSFIQKITGQTIPLPSIAAPTINAMPPPPHPKQARPPPPQPHPTPIATASPPPASQPPPAQQAPPQRAPMPATPQPPQTQSTDIVMTPASESTTPHAADTPGSHDGSGGGATSSRWPKAEVHALIQLRSNLDTRYQEAGPKGPLWEEISAGMRRLGYSRNAKRCKEKWENINKYFKKVKESNKKRPEDSKTCPYFHQLDALYRNKAALTSSSAVAAHAGGAGSTPPATQPTQETVTVTAAAPISQTPPPPAPAPPTMPPSESSSQQHAAKNGGGSNAAAGNGGGAVPEHGDSGGMQAQASNGGVAASRYFGEAGAAGGGTASAAKKRTS
ncbi:unnamed protein product [Urochloa humidicola]